MDQACRGYVLRRWEHDEAGVKSGPWRRWPHPGPPPQAEEGAKPGTATVFSCLREGVIPAPSELLPTPPAEHDNTRRIYLLSLIPPAARATPTRRSALSHRACGEGNTRRVDLLSLSSGLRRRAHQTRRSAPSS